MAFSGVTSVKFTAAPERIKQRKGEGERLSLALVSTAAENRKHTPVHPKVPLRPDGLNKAIGPETQQGALMSERLCRRCREVRDGEALHAGVKARSILLVLQPSLGQVDGKHAGHPD